MNQSDQGPAWSGRAAVNLPNYKPNEYARQTDGAHIPVGIPGLGLNFSQASAAPAANSHSFSKYPHHGRDVRASDGMDGSHERQVSEEGELEDIYEPDEVEASNGASNSIGVHVPGQDREKSGSYSPYLSSREVSMDCHPQTQAATATASDLAGAKAQAKEAILRAWPFNMRFQNFINEGLDKSVLKTLFSDLGLSTGETGAAAKQEQAPALAGSSKENGNTALGSKSVDGMNVSAMDKAEERKDKIARLLAAKKPRQSETVSKTSLPKAPPHGVSKSAKPTLTQMQKSKLLQEKMAALRKSREDALKTASENQKGQKNSGSNYSTADERANTNSGAAELSESAHDSGNDTDGLVVSDDRSVPTAQSLHHAAQQLSRYNLERTASQPPVISKPFDQNRRSRPFLINVSDDEDDDAEMDIDSSESCDGIEPVASGAILPADSALLQPRRSPASVSTPQESIASSENLLSMNKRIEEMKRRIAEAEARKRAKASLHASPSVSKPPSTPRESSEPVSERYRDVDPVSALIEGIRGETEVRRSRSRAASERISLIEARRREQQGMLKKLELEMARIKQQMETDDLEEERLKEAGSSDVLQSEEPAPEPRNSELVDGASPPTSSTSSAGSASSVQHSDDGDPEAGNAQEVDDVMDDAESYADEHHGERPESPTSDAPLTDGLEQPLEEETQSPEDIKVIDDAIPTAHRVADERPPSAAPAAGAATALAEEVEEHPTAMQSRIPGKLTSSQVHTQEGTDESSAPGSNFAPYETPLQYFRAYRFHPSYDESVSGGLRSLTYSNKIDVQRQLCPDELSGSSCPRGEACEFQHFENMKAPDDQILLQLGAGAAENYTEEEKQAYIEGLRQLISDYKNRDINDFDTISHGLVEYRARFLGDRTKILPLSGVSL